jgi:alpha-L-rhamnosidase
MYMAPIEMKRKNRHLWIVLLLFPFGYSYAQSSIQVENLRCEYRVNPLGIDMPHPRFSWELTAESGWNKKQTARQILVSSDSLALTKDKANAWDSRKTSGNETNQLAYKGKPLKAHTLYYWKVRVWDETDNASQWSPVARFLTGPLTSGDWKAQWIGEQEYAIPLDEHYYKPAGYRSIQETKPDVRKWVSVDLGKIFPIDSIELYPAFQMEKTFPLRFTVEAASTSDFKKSKIVTDESENDVIVQSGNHYSKKYPNPVSGRYIRLNVSKIAKENNVVYEFGLSEWKIFSGGRNIALKKYVQISDTNTLTLDAKWEAQWITDGYIKPADNPKSQANKILPSPLLRKEIHIGKIVKNAFLTASALGIYEAYINGEKVGTQCLAPEFTDYDSHLQFQTFDVTGLLKPGANVLGASLADGWYAGARWSHPHRGGYGFFRKFIGQLQVNYIDGTSEIIATDASWKLRMQGPVTEASLFNGEIYEAKYEQQGWNKPGFNDSRWTPVSVYPDEKVNFCAQLNEPIAVIDEIKPIAISKSGDKYIFDMGQNIVGWCRLSLPYNPYREIRLRFGEMLNDDGSLYLENLRAAKQTDIYRPDNEQTVQYEPRFTLHGFRYVEISGLTQDPSFECLLGKVVASSSPVTGSFACSDKSVNKLWENIRRTQWGNQTSIPTDCPQRDEREGWMGDAQIFSQTAIYNLDMAGFYTKWARDIRDCQMDDGRLPDIVPHDGKLRGFINAPGWADAAVIVPWRLYQNYGDTEILAKQYETMKKFIDYIRRYNPALIWGKAHGYMYCDWLNGDMIISGDYPKKGGAIPQYVFSTAYFAYSTGILAKSAKLLGKENDYQYYSRLAESIRKAFVEKFVSPDGKIEGDTQAGYAMALQMEILPEELRPRAAAHLAEAVKAYDYRISTGIHATVCLMNQLSDYGYGDIAYKLLTSRRFPSWFYSIDQGATTIWERWDGYVRGRGFQDPVMNSFNHVALGAVGEWMYSRIIGIRHDEDRPGFRHFFIKPQPGNVLQWAKGTYHAITGNIAVSWTNKDHLFTLDVTVPVNTEATIVLPYGGKIHRVGSGKHHFTVENQ